MKPRWPLYRLLPVYRRYRAGANLAALARELGVSRQYLHQLFRRFQLPSRPYPHLTPAMIQRAIKLRQQGNTLMQIGMKLDVHYSTVWWALKRSQPDHGHRSMGEKAAPLSLPSPSSKDVLSENV